MLDTRELFLKHVVLLHTNGISVFDLMISLDRLEDPGATVLYSLGQDKYQSYATRVVSEKLTLSLERSIEDGTTSAG